MTTVNAASTHAVIGLLGGTFDPIHNGHLQLVLHVQQTLSLCEVQLLPCYQPVHKQHTALTSAHARVAMLNLAIQTHPTLSVNLTEIQHQCACYTIDTLRELYTPTQSCCFLLGMDAWLGLSTWKEWTRLTDYAHLIVCTRPGYASTRVENEVEIWLSERLTDDPNTLTQIASPKQPGRVFFHALPESPVAARSLRQRIFAGENCQQDLPSGVWDYILAHRLYREGSS